jgi:hypothetical protein
MKSRTIWTLCCVAGVLLCFAPCVLAQDCTQGTSGCLTLTSAGNNIMDNVYVGPYTGQIGSNAGQQIICDDFADESKVGNGWSTTANTFQTIGNTLWGQVYGVAAATTMYEQAAYLTLQMLSGNYNSTQIGYMSYAIWYIFDPSGVTNYLGSKTGSNASIWAGLLNFIQMAGTNYGNLTAAQLAEFTIYTPTGCTGGPGTCAGQEFLVVAPEGGAALAYILLAGVACFGAVFRSRSQRAKRAMA